MTSSAPTKRPLAADPLTAIAPLLRVRPEIQEICRFAARWEAEHQAEPLGWAQFHIVTNEWTTDSDVLNSASPPRPVAKSITGARRNRQATRRRKPKKLPPLAS